MNEAQSKAVKELVNKTLHEICLPCVHENKNGHCPWEDREEWSPTKPWEWRTPRGEYCTLAHKAVKAILSHPDLALVDYNKRDDYGYPTIIPLAEALKEADNGST